ncbi:MAG: UDP-N-acetylglucosamine 2-epimerase (non-hydrolyzing) [Armatimonadetes bacterium]|nr:UDP-N-acetylglucosamine 2-epimerase (non-hydrolyzing) [Armatimonadota bacterium]
MKVLSVVGTRPNFVKEALINKEMKRRGIHEVLVHTGQHYDYEMSRVFFQELDIPDPDHHLQVSTGLPGRQTAEIIEAVESILIKEEPDITLVYGDVTSTLAAALASVKLRIPVAHVEAGVRTQARYNPEEINRRATDTVSELLLANCEDAYEELIKENHTGSRIVLTGDIMKDVLIDTIKRFNINVVRGDYTLCTLHRAENVDNKHNLSAILRGLAQSGQKVVFPVHPRTRKKLDEFGLTEEFENSGNIQFSEPRSYLDFVTLLAGANKVVTDSGGVRRESYILAKPTIVAIELVWFPCLVKSGWKVVAGPASDKIADAIVNFEPPDEHPELLGDGRAYVRIVDEIEKQYNDRNKTSGTKGG